MFDSTGSAVNRKLKTISWRRRNKNVNPTIISQNCIGGVIYSDLGLKFSSPTINMFIEDNDFVKLAENPRQYFYTQRPKPIGFEQAGGCLIAPFSALVILSATRCTMRLLKKHVLVGREGHPALI